jgi:aminotransferase
VRTFCWIHVAAGLRDALAHQLHRDGIYTTFKYWPIHRMSLYRQASGRFRGAEQAAASVLLLPLHHGLSSGDVERVIAAIREFGSRRAQ